MKVNRVAGSGAALAGALLVAACGGSGGAGHPAPLTLGKEYPAIKAAARAATSVHVSGSVVQDGKPISLDLALVKPSSAAGSVTQGSASYTVVLTPSRSYIQISKLFLRAAHLPASLCAKVCGKYLVISSSSASSFANVSMSSLIGAVFSKPPSKDEEAIKLTADQYQGQPAWSGQGHGESIFIARGGTPYLLSVSKNGQNVSFSGWNTTTVSAPRASKVETTAQLGALVAGG